MLALFFLRLVPALEHPVKQIHDLSDIFFFIDYHKHRVVACYSSDDMGEPDIVDSFAGSSSAARKGFDQDQVVGGFAGDYGLAEDLDEAIGNRSI